MSSLYLFNYQWEFNETSLPGKVWWEGVLRTKFMLLSQRSRSLLQVKFIQYGFHSYNLCLKFANNLFLVIAADLCNNLLRQTSNFRLYTHLFTGIEVKMLHRTCVFWYDVIALRWIMFVYMPCILILSTYSRRDFIFLHSDMYI